MEQLDLHPGFQNITTKQGKQRPTDNNSDRSRKDRYIKKVHEEVLFDGCINLLTQRLLTERIVCLKLPAK